jgi:hypothetical protein
MREPRVGSRSEAAAVRDDAELAVDDGLMKLLLVMPTA